MQADAYAQLDAFVLASQKVDSNALINASGLARRPAVSQSLLSKYVSSICVPILYAYARVSLVSLLQETVENCILMLNFSVGICRK